MSPFMTKHEASLAASQAVAAAEYEQATAESTSALNMRIAGLRTALMDPHGLRGTDRAAAVDLLTNLDRLSIERMHGTDEHLPSLRASAIGQKHIGQSETLDLAVAKIADADVTERAESLTAEAARLRDQGGEDNDRLAAAAEKQAATMIAARDSVRVHNTATLDEMADPTHQAAIDRLAKRDHKSAVRLAQHYNATPPPPPPSRSRGHVEPEPEPPTAA